MSENIKNYEYRTGWRRTSILLIALVCLSINVFAQKASSSQRVSVPSRDISTDIYKRASQFIEDMRFDSAAANWKNAQIGNRVIELYRPDIEGVAYYEFSLTNPNGESAGFITLSNGTHEQPIANRSDNGISPAEQLIREAESNGSSVAKIYKLNDESYVAEDVNGEMVAHTPNLPLKIVGQQLDWLDRDVQPASITSYTTGNGDESGEIPEQRIISSGDTETQFRLEEWSSWRELKENYRETYAVMNEAVKRESASDWKAERALQEYGEAFFADEVGFFPSLPSGIKGIKTVKGNPELFRAEVIQRDGINPIIKVSVLRSLDAEMPVVVSVNYADRIDTIKFTILPESYRERVGKNSGTVSSKVLKEGDESSKPSDLSKKWYGFGSGPWGPWYASWAAHHNDQRIYDQINANTGVNTSNCYSGCGATAWAMLFGWGDHRAWEQDPTWSGRWGLYRANGGYGADAHAPAYQDAGINNMTWEIRNDIFTFCAFGSGATLPSTMWQAAFYLNGRTYTTLSTNYNGLGFGLPWLRDQAGNSIVDRDVPAIIGTGFLSHYPLAYGYQERTRRLYWGFWYSTDYDRQFYVNMGWGSIGQNKWVAAHTWFVGQIYPNRSTDTKQLVAKHSNKCLDVNGASGSDGANVIQHACHGGNNQKWRLEPVNTVGNYYRILANHSGKALDVAGVSTATGANVHQWEWWMGDNQLWELIPSGGGYYSIKAKHSGKCLDVAGISTANGANVYQWDCHGGNNQLWKLVP
jgi:hypothetical protein